MGQAMAAWPTQQLSTPPLSDPLVDVAFDMLEIGELSMHVNARGPTETHLSTALEILRIKEQKMDHLPLLRTPV